MSKPYRPTRRCRWCKSFYDPKHNSARHCPKNPHRRKAPPSIVTIGAVTLKPNLWATS